jgi:hypothetical protein
MLPGCGALYCWGTGVPSDVIETFLALARKNLAIAYTKIALDSVTPAQESQLWCLIHGVESAMKIRVRAAAGLARENNEAKRRVNLCP